MQKLVIEKYLKVNAHKRNIAPLRGGTNKTIDHSSRSRRDSSSIMRTQDSSQDPYWKFNGLPIRKIIIKQASKKFSDTTLPI